MVDRLYWHYLGIDKVFLISLIFILVKIDFKNLIISWLFLHHLPIGQSDQ